MGSGKLSGSKVNEHLGAVREQSLVRACAEGLKYPPLVLLHPEAVEVKHSDRAFPGLHALEETRDRLFVVRRQE